MEARTVEELPVGDDWQYEPKWDGFRCLAFRDGDQVKLQSKSGRPLERYFPDLVEALRRVGTKQFVLDGEIVIPIGGRLSFDDLLMRIHPAASRVAKLAAEYPAMFVIIDLLANDQGHALVQSPLEKRRASLETFAKKHLRKHARIRLSPATTKLPVAKKWFSTVGGNLDGIIAKRLSLPYRSGERDGMVKMKHLRTADCVVGGFRYGDGTRLVGSLLLGLYEDGLLHHVGFTSGFTADERKRMTAIVRPLIKAPGFNGRAPGGASRWSTKRSSDWQPLRTKLVVEVRYDHFTGERFRHGTGFIRWRPDKRPSQCTMEQVKNRGSETLKLLK
ncbi:MAG: ATP-dependent DNA ligase [Pirellula sp.]|nr:ATP-dependent DNA ligase [Pirellula sp.]